MSETPPERPRTHPEGAPAVKRPSERVRIAVLFGGPHDGDYLAAPLGVDRLVFQSVEPISAYSLMQPVERVQAGELKVREDHYHRTGLVLADGASLFLYAQIASR